MTAKRSKIRGKLPRSMRRSSPGAPPGSIVVDKTAARPRIDVVAYGPDDLTSIDGPDLDAMPELLKAWPVTWVNVVGLGDPDVIRHLGRVFQLHDLALEDAVNAHQRPKVDDYKDFAYIATQMMLAGERVETQQVSIFLGRNFVLTFQERAGTCFDSVRQRLSQGPGRIRGQGPDYLVYALLDAIIDGYFSPLEAYGELVEELEDRALIEPDPALVSQIHDARRDLLMFRRAIWPQRELMNALIRGTSALFKDTTQPYLRDCYDHTVQLLDMIETYRDIAASLFELYLSSVNTKMNEVIKVLTIIATLFIPLTFVTGLYGMNFNTSASPWNMPELNWYWGYPSALGVLIAIALGLLFMFRRRGWIGARPAS